MKKVLAFTVLMFSVFSSVSSAQETSTRSNNETNTQDVQKAQDAVNKVLLDAGISFKEGLLAYVNGDRSVAGEKFNKSVEVFLYSALNIQREQKLQSCYNVLVETIYRIEFPSESQLPRIRDLGAICNWNIDDALADKVATLAKNSIIKPIEPKPLQTPKPKQEIIGFTSSDFEPSPGDELARLELTSDELAVEGRSKSGIKIVKAKTGDTVSKVAERNNANPIEVAKFNGLLPNSILGAGREIKIPTDILRESGRPATVSCNLTLKNAPVLRGLKLGMTPNAVSRVLGRTLKLKDHETDFYNGTDIIHVNIGEKTFFYLARPTQKISKLAGIHSMLLTFFDNSLYEIYLKYDKQDFGWKDGRELSLILSEKLNLPKDAWYTTSNSLFEFMACKEFKIFIIAFPNGSSDFHLGNEIAAKTVKAKAKQAVLNEEQKKKVTESEKKRAFKP